MEIFTLFDDIKYFKIEFLLSVGGNELIEVENIVDNAFDMSKDIQLQNIEIKRDEITVDCEHSLTHAEVSVHTSNQKGLLAYIMNGFELLNINIITAKIHSTKHKVKDSFLMEKHNSLCDNTEKIYELLTKAK